MSERTIADDELLYRRIPLGKDWFEPPDRISSFNFKLRPDELGISVYRAVIVDAAGVLNKPDAIAGSMVAQATTGQVRDLKDGNGKILGLDVVVVNDENNPGHAEIRGPVPGEISQGASRALKRIFQVVDSHPPEA